MAAAGAVHHATDQTPELVRRDIDILRKHFRYGCVNLFTPSRKSANLLDEEIQSWFREEFAWLEEAPTIEVLWRNTDFGVGAAETTDPA